MYTTPTVVGERLYIGSCSGQFRALNKTTGELLWGYDITQDGNQMSFHGDPLVSDSLILTGADGQGIGHLYAFNRHTGDVAWMYPDERGFTSDLIQHNGLTYAVSSMDELICVDMASGELKWYFSDTSTTARSFSSSPAIADGRVFFGSRRGHVFALSADSGEVLWSQDVGGLAGTAIVLADDDLYLGNKHGYIYRLRQDDGRIMDTLLLCHGSDAERFATIGNPLIVDDVFIVLCDAASELAAIDRTSMQVRWRLPAAREWTSYRPYLWQGCVLVGDQDGLLTAVHPASGEVLWEKQFEGAIRGIGSDGNTLYIGTIEGMVYAWDAGGVTEE